MSAIEITLNQLRGMIGQKVVYQGTPYQVIEIIETNTSLVLQVSTRDKVIQADQHGDAQRRVPDTVTIPVLSADRSELHPLFLALELV